jgi:formamidopyrimidine-DNA glycosylase
LPELPEVETIARDLQAKIAGAKIRAVEVSKPDVLRIAGPKVLAKRTTGATIERSWRRAKLVVLDLSTGDRLVVSLRFTGNLLVEDGPFSEDDRKYSTVRWKLSDGRTLHYYEVRRLGTVSLMNPRQFEKYAARLGVEPLEAEFTADLFYGLLQSSRQAIKKRIMDQTAVVGIGDIIEVLEEALNSRGTSFRDYRDASGEPGDFVRRLAAYGREGLPCPRCGKKLVGTHAIDGRATVLCVRCQS